MGYTEERVKLNIRRESPGTVMVSGLFLYDNNGALIRQYVNIINDGCEKLEFFRYSRIDFD